VGNTLIVKIHQTLENLIHDVFGFSFNETGLPLCVAGNVSEEVAAGAELEKYLPEKNYVVSRGTYQQSSS
jgi:hypothetical protein